MIRQREQALLDRLLSVFPKMTYADQVFMVKFAEASAEENPANRRPSLRLIVNDNKKQ